MEVTERNLGNLHQGYVVMMGSLGHDLGVQAAWAWDVSGTLWLGPGARLRQEPPPTPAWPGHGRRGRPRPSQRSGGTKARAPAPPRRVRQQRWTVL